MAWYTLKEPDTIDSPALLVFPERIKDNIQTMIAIAGSSQRLIPHIKTHKMAEVIRLQQEKGIRRFKCATIAEAELLAQCGAEEIILAYQLNISKARRFLELVSRYPDIRFVSLVDNSDSVKMLQALFHQRDLTARVLVDVDNGMHRTGFPVDGDLFHFYEKVTKLPFIECYGLHVYDGHIHISDFETRKKAVEEAFLPVDKLLGKIRKEGLPRPLVIAGGSPSFTIHALRDDVVCSPGTCLLWDQGYADMLPEQDFVKAAVLLTRVISKPQSGILTMDLGHKSVAAENPIDKRVFFLNLPHYRVTGQSEEHLVLEVDDNTWEATEVGAAFYAIPQHICPTVALYEEVQVVEERRVISRWQVRARDKKLNI